MKEQEVDLSSVHWTQGMLLMPEHFVRQERYVDSLFLWVSRYATDAYGLVGAGPRVEKAERGAAKHDPLIHVDDDGEAVNVSVVQCRGISPSGDIIEIDPERGIHRSFQKSALEGQQELGVYVVCEPHDKVIEDGVEDIANPQVRSSRRRRYRIELDVSASDAPHSLMVSRVRKAEGSLRYEKLSGFIPVCTTLVSHSELKRAWERLSEQMVGLTDRYMQLHRAVVEYIAMAGERRINTREEEETLQFAGRMIAALESSIYEALNPMQAPQRFFQQLYRAIRSAAVYLDLSPPTLDYFRQLAEVGVTEFNSLLEQERKALEVGRELTIHDDLNQDVQRIEQSLHRLRHLEEALEGKYLDYRVSAALEALSFLFDRRSDPPALYQTLARPARPQLSMDGNELTFVFAPLRLEGQSYRLVLIRENDARIERGTEIRAKIQINSGAGQGFEPIYQAAVCELPDQRNLAIDFDRPPNAHTIFDLRVMVSLNWPIRSCLLYERRRMVESNSRLMAAEPARFNPAPPKPPKVEPVFNRSRLVDSVDSPLPAPPNKPSRVEEGENIRPIRSSRSDEQPVEPDWNPPVRRKRIID